MARLPSTPEGRAELDSAGLLEGMLKETLHPNLVCWDGEGYTTPNGTHHYMLFKNSDGAAIRDPHLTTRQCLQFILDNASELNTNFIYFGGYDVTHWLRDLPPSLVTNMLTTNEATGFQYEDSTVMTVQYFPNKWFTITGMSAKGKWKRITVYDVGSFFQCSALKAWKSRGIEVPEVIASGKAARGDFTWEDIDEVEDYCTQELALYVRLIEQLLSEFKEAGMHLARLHGPGAVAASVMESRLIHKCRMVDILPEMEMIVSSAFFGGRFEQFQGGKIKGPIYIYDINSAYPTMLATLPDLRGATFRKVDAFVPGVPGIYYCTGASDDSFAPHPLPHRERTSISFPHTNPGVWLWHPEAEVAQHVEYGYVLDIASPFLPFQFVPRMYEKRKEWKAGGVDDPNYKGGERALKLALNSLFGKTAQTISFQGLRPKFTELIWAGMITSGTRRMIWDAIQEDPDAVIAVETDSVISTRPLNLKCGANLGDWEYETADEITYIQSGVYFRDQSGKQSKKTRGMSAAKLDYDTSMAWLAAGAKEPMIVTEPRFIGITSGRWDVMGNWETMDKQVKFGGGKRVHDAHDCPACQNGIGLHEGAHRLRTHSILSGEPSERRPIPWIDGLAQYSHEWDGTPRTDIPGVEAPEAVYEWAGARQGGEWSDD